MASVTLLKVLLPNGIPRRQGHLAVALFLDGHNDGQRRREPTCLPPLPRTSRIATADSSRRRGGRQRPFVLLAPRLWWQRVTNHGRRI